MIKYTQQDHGIAAYISFILNF